MNPSNGVPDLNEAAPPADLADITPQTAADSALAGRIMHTRQRETWLIPLLAVPLSRIGLSAQLTDAEMRLINPECDPDGVRARASRIRSITESVHQSGGTRALTDDEAWMLMIFVHDYIWLGRANTLLAGFMLMAIGVHSDLPAEPRARAVAGWISSGSAHPALGAFVSLRALQMSHNPPLFLPGIQSRHEVVTRAIDRRLSADAVTTWEQALTLAEQYWAEAGCHDLGILVVRAVSRVERDPQWDLKSQRLTTELEKERAQMRAERKRLEDAMATAQEQLRMLRRIQGQLRGLRDEVERLRLREAELVHARDRAVSHGEALEAANQELERANKEAMNRLAALAPKSLPQVEARALPQVVFAEDHELPADLLAGRDVFYFTGDVRGASATGAAESLRALGAVEVRTYCLRKGSTGPETFPAKALVVVDIRFAGHRQSALIIDRAVRSRVQYLVVRSGKGSLARVVAGSLQSSAA